MQIKTRKLRYMKLWAQHSILDMENYNQILEKTLELGPFWIYAN